MSYGNGNGAMVPYGADNTQYAQWEQRLQQQQQQLAIAQQQVSSARQEVALAAQQVQQRRQVVERDEATNWAERDRLRTQRITVEKREANAQMNEQRLNGWEKQLDEIEKERRRKRTRSEAFIEDEFSRLSATSVANFLTDPSLRIRKHAQSNISSCVNGGTGMEPTFARFTATDIAPPIVPKLHHVLTSHTGRAPVDSEIRFAQGIIASPPLVRALATTGQCNRLADFLIDQHHEHLCRLAIAAFRQMVGMNTAVVAPAYQALALVVPLLPEATSTSGKAHPAVEFVRECTPKVIEDCFNNNRWTNVAPLVAHRITGIRSTALAKVELEGQHADRVQTGIVDSNLLAMLDPLYRQPNVPADVVSFFAAMVPKLALHLCRRSNQVKWLLQRLGDPNPKIGSAVVDALRIGVFSNEPAIHAIFVEDEVLHRLDTATSQSPGEVIKLLCEIIPALAAAHAHHGRCGVLLAFLENSETALCNAAAQALSRIVHSSMEDRMRLAADFLNLDFTKESTLRACNIVLPAFCRDWASRGELQPIVRILAHPEQRVRLAANNVWFELVSKGPQERSHIVRSGQLAVFFDLCDSPMDDSLALGCQCLPYMASEFYEAGPKVVRRILKYLNHPRVELRRAAMQTMRNIGEVCNGDKTILIDGGAFAAVIAALEARPDDFLDTADDFVLSTSLAVSSSSEACFGLLRLIESTNSKVEEVGRKALALVATTNTDHRATMRRAVLSRMVTSSSSSLEYAATAVLEWIGPDLARLRDFETLFDLVSHTDKHIQSAALLSLRSRIKDRAYQEALERANVVALLRTLATSKDNPEAISFVTSVLHSMALTLASTGHVPVLLLFSTSEEPRVREGAIDAIQIIASGSEGDRRHLVVSDVVERLVSVYDGLEQTGLQLASVVIPKLAVDYVRADRVGFILSLVDHARQQIRQAAVKACSCVAKSSAADRLVLRTALLSRFDDDAPSAALRSVAAEALAQNLARDLVVEELYPALFQLLENEDARIRAPAIQELCVHIHNSDARALRRLVDANVIGSLLDVLKKPKEDVLLFTSEHVLPALGPSLSQADGAVSVLPLLSHSDTRICSAAAICLRNAVDSNHGDPSKLASTSIATTLSARMDSSESFRDLWCHLIVKIAPYLSAQADIETILDGLSSSRPTVKEAASRAMLMMATSSEDARLRLMPVFLRRLDRMPSDAMREFAQVIQLSAFTFITSGEERRLLNIVQFGRSQHVDASVKAVVHVLSSGTSTERQTLAQAGVFATAMALRDKSTHRELALTLLYAIVTHLGSELMTSDTDADKLLGLFDDPDVLLSQRLCQALVDDPDLCERKTFSDLFPLLLGKVSNQAVCKLLCSVPTPIVQKLLFLRRVQVITQSLLTPDLSVTRAYLRAIREALLAAGDQVKDMLAESPDFIPALGRLLMRVAAVERQIASELVDMLSNGSEFRSGRMMTEGIGESLAWIAVHNSEAGADEASIKTLRTLFVAAPDHADQLVKDCLPAICGILQDAKRSIKIYTSVMELLADIVRSGAHFRRIFRSNVIVIMVQWLSPRHSVQIRTCRDATFSVAQSLAQNNDSGRKALLDANVIPVIIELLHDSSSINVFNGCKILDALAYTGTYRRQLVQPCKLPLEHITSPFRKSKLADKSNKGMVKLAAKGALLTLKSTKKTAASSPLELELNGGASRVERTRSLRVNGTSERMGVTGPMARRVASEADVKPLRNVTITFKDNVSRLSSGHGRSESAPSHLRLAAVQEDGG